MSSIESNITIDVPDGVNVQQVVNLVREVITSINGLETTTHIVEVDDPISASPINLRERGT